MYSQSRKWVAPRVLKEDQNKRMNNSRRKIAPNSIAWELNLDVEQHKKEFAEIQQAQLERNIKYHTDDAAERIRLGLPATPPAIKPAFGGKVFKGNDSAVLSRKTVFAPDFEEGREVRHATNHGWINKEIAVWPSRMEMKYEGDDRISTDKLHGRFLGAPRTEGNETVNWQQRSIIPQYAMEDFYYPVPREEEIWLRVHWIREHQFSDMEGVEALGKDLMDMLNI
ncbi:uncharacterized protein RCC_10392 [Ramularia collo-cygni]|uniref:Uncharacterized protein n=1 Tax=Ramularia collo-cygni TaxID=112498 RepID=A0A2D3V5M8_9PEZI|nr:uncharacterized protein RCC_10392 [Ramularia collo-cygni]CZT24666.1 uncharacterized protein RCC_10392 [Ramularia collo-cygni]